MVSRVCVGEEANWAEDAVVQTAWADVEASLPGTVDAKLTGLTHNLRLFAAQKLLFSVSCSVFLSCLRFPSQRSIPVENMFLWGSAWNTTPATVRRHASLGFCLSVWLLFCRLVHWLKWMIVLILVSELCKTVQICLKRCGLTSNVCSGGSCL